MSFSEDDMGQKSFSCRRVRGGGGGGRAWVFRLWCGCCCRACAALSTKALMTWAASGAEASAPQPPCSTSTATTMSGLRRGAMPTNHALARSAPLPKLRAPALWLTIWAVPVLPAKSMPSRWTAAAVPLVVVAAMASVMVCQLAGVTGMVLSPEPG